MAYFDLHCDTITECYDRKTRLNHNSLMVSLEHAPEKYRQVFAIWIDDIYRGDAAFNRFMNVYHYFYDEIFPDCKEHLFHLGSHFDDKNTGYLLSLESGAALAGKLSNLEKMKELGVCSITLTWNGVNDLGGGCFASPANQGLTPFGMEIIRKMEEMDMVVDVSHLAGQGFWETEKITQKPFVASHSNAKTLCSHPRNLTDDQIRVIIERRGLIGINFYPLFLKEEGKDATLADVIGHMEYILELGGEKILALGSDMDGAAMPPDFHDIRDIGKIETLMRNRGFTNNLIDDIMFKNAQRFYQNMHCIK